MEIARERRAGAKRIGELLVAAGVIRQEVLMEALQIAKKSSTPVGRVLMTIGELTERELLAAIEVQSMIRDGHISAEFGVRALNVCIKGRVSLDDAFQRLGWQAPAEREVVPSGELGQLLLSAGIVTQTVLDQCMQQSEENSLPLGRCLVLARAISSNLLASALTAQVLIRDGKVTYEQAVAGLAASNRKQQSIEQSLSETGAYKIQEQQKIKVGELLSQAGLVTESDKVSAIEKGLAEQQPVGQVLVQSGMISPTALDESLKLQDMVNEGKINTLQAAEILRQANNRNVPVEVVMQEKTARSDEVDAINRVMSVIRRAELLTLDDIQRAEGLASQLQISLGEVILSKELIEKRLIDATMQGQKLVDTGIMTEAHLIKVLRFLRNNRIEFSDALKTVSPDYDDVGDISTDEYTDDQPEEKKEGGLFGGLGKLFGR